MPESSNPTPRRHNRANWVGLRTLRQLPKVIGETSAGEPIVEVRSVRLVLREGANHFSRMANCSKCGREVPGAPVLTPSDLDHPPHPVICRDCVRTASAPVLAVGSRKAEAKPEPEPEPDAGAGATGAPSLAAVEARIAEVEALVRQEQANWEAAVDARIEAAETELRALAAKELARAQEDVDRMMKGVVERLGNSTGVDAGVIQALDARVNRSVEQLTERLDDLRSELGAELEAKLAQVRAGFDDHPGPDVEGVRARADEVAREQEDLRRRLEELAGGLTDEAGAQAGRVETLEAELRALREAFDRQPAVVEQDLSRRLEELDAQLTGVRETSGTAAGGGERVEALEAQLGTLRLALDTASFAGDRLDGLETQLAAVRETLDAATGLARAEAARTGERVDALELQLGALRQALDTSALAGERVDAVEAELGGFRETLETASGRARVEVTRVEEALGARLDGVEAQLARLDGVEAQLARLDEVEARVPALDGVEAQLRDLDETGAARIAEVTEKLGRVEDGLDKRIRGLVDERMEASSAEAARIEAALTERLDRQAEQMRQAEAEGRRVDDLEQQLDDAVGRLAAIVESQRAELNGEVKAGLAEVRTSVASVKSDSAGRLRALEEAVAQRARELADLVDLQAALDAGLGELRSEIEQLRDSARRAAHLDTRLDSLIDVTQLAAEPERGRRGGRKSADALSGLTAAVQGLLQDHRQIRAQLATLENESETAVKASARASAQATAVHPLRQDVRALRDEVVAQNQAVASLAKTVESLRRAVQPKPPPKPPAKAPAKAPGAPATKGATLAKAPAAKAPAAKKATPARAAKPAKAPKKTKPS